MALRCVVLCYTNAHPTGVTGATLSIRAAFFEDGFGALEDMDVDVDFATPLTVVPTITNAVIDHALTAFSKTLLATNTFLPTYQKGSLV